MLRYFINQLFFHSFIGTGNACMSSSVTVITQRNFPKLSALASNLESIGGSLGIMLSPLLIFLLIQQYGWRWAMRFHAIIGLNIAVVSWILRTPKVVQSARDQNLTFVRKFIVNIKNLSLMFGDMDYVIGLISHILFLQMINVTVVHTVSRITTLGYSATWGTFLLSLNAFASLAAR